MRIQRPMDDIVALSRRAFVEFGARALWNIKQMDEPTVAQALAITRQLRIEGDMNARRLAEQIEQMARAHFQTAIRHPLVHRRQA